MYLNYIQVLNRKGKKCGTFMLVSNQDENF